MRLDIFEELTTGEDERVLRVGESDICAVVDWRDGVTEITEAILDFLPSGFLSTEAVSPYEIRIHAGDREARVIKLQDQKQEPFINELNKLINPEFEMRQFRPFDGDCIALLVRPTSWWSEVTIQNPELVDRYFLTTERLAAYWSKSYLARFFSKP